MSKGLGVTQRDILRIVGRYEYLTTSKSFVYRVVDAKKQSVCRAIKTLINNGYLLEVDNDLLRPTSKGLLYWAEHIATQKHNASNLTSKGRKTG